MSLTTGFIISNHRKYNFVFSFFLRLTEIDWASWGNLVRRRKSLSFLQGSSCQFYQQIPSRHPLTPEPRAALLHQLQGTHQPKINRREIRQRYHNLGKCIPMNSTENWLSIFKAERAGGKNKEQCTWAECATKSPVMETIVTQHVGHFLLSAKMLTTTQILPGFVLPAQILIMMFQPCCPWAELQIRH